MGKRLTGIGVGALAFLLVATPASARACSPATFLEPPAHYAAAVESARSLLCERVVPNVPGMQVAVAVDGRLIWSEAYGQADLERRVPVSRTMRFRVGSISKPITADALALLVQQGRIDLDAPVQRYVPGFPLKPWPVTARELAGHTAGIRAYRDYQAEMHSNVHYPSVTASLMVFAADTLLFEPGTRFSYSTYGYSLLAAALEGASGMSYPELVESSVLRPLGMTHTGIEVAGRTNESTARPYDPDSTGKGFVLCTPVDNSYKLAGGGYLSTAEDVARFGLAHLNPGRLTEASLQFLFTSMTTRDGKPTGYGAGWYVDRDSMGHDVAVHAGSAVGGASILLVDRGSGVVLAMCVNLTSTPEVGAMLWPVWRELHAIFDRATSE